MKKQLLSIIAAVSVSALFAQVPSTAWATNQQAIFPTNANVQAPGVKIMDAVDANVVWVTGWDAAFPNRNYNWYSRSINAGVTFAGGNIYSDTNTYQISNMEGIDANTAWVAAFKKHGPGPGQGGGAIHRTTNGGTNWINMTPAGMYTATTSFANFVTFLTPSVGIANGDPVGGEFELWRTTDAGLTWTQTPGANIPNPLSGEFAIVNLYAKVGTSNLWFGTNGNRMFRTTDGGLTYSVAAIGPATNTITQIAFSSPSNGMCFMINSSLNLELWNSYDGGVTWAQITPVPANLGQFDITPIPGTGNIASYGAGAGNLIISYSGDNGISWTDWGSTNLPYLTGDFVNATTAWAGAWDFAGSTSNFTNVWKYTGPAITGTAVPAAAFSLPATLCLGSNSSTVIPVNSSVGSPSLSYFWQVLPSGATLSSATASAPTITFPSAGSYTVALTATNTVGSNTSYWVVNVTACTAPVASFSVPAAACTGFTLSPNSSSTGAPNPAYFWSITPTAGSTLTAPTSSNPLLQFGSSGTYTIALMVTNASGTAQTTQTVSVAPCLPIVSFNMPSVICLEGAASTRTFQTTNTTTNPPNATGGSFTYTWTISPNTGVTVLPGYNVANLLQVKVTSTVTQYTVTLKVKNPSGTASYSQTINAGDCTGISENVLADNMLVFPNPAHEQLNIALPVSNTTYKIKLTNILGSIVFEEKVAGSSKETTTINLANKPKGVYFLTVESNNEKATKKIVIE